MNNYIDMCNDINNHNKIIQEIEKEKTKIRQKLTEEIYNELDEKYNVSSKIYKYHRKNCVTIYGFVCKENESIIFHSFHTSGLLKEFTSTNHHVIVKISDYENELQRLPLDEVRQIITDIVTKKISNISEEDRSNNLKLIKKHYDTILNSPEPNKRELILSKGI